MSIHQVITTMHSKPKLPHACNVILVVALITGVKCYEPDLTNADLAVYLSLLSFIMWQVLILN